MGGRNANIVDVPKCTDMLSTLPMYAAHPGSMTNNAAGNDHTAFLVFNDSIFLLAFSGRNGDS